MTDKHPDAGVEVAIKVVEGHRKLFEGDSKREALCTSILSCLRALPAQQPEPLPTIKGAHGRQKAEAYD